MLNHPLSIKHLQEVLKETLQIIIFDSQGYIIESTNTFADLSYLYGKTVYGFDPFIESLREVIESLTPENSSIRFPRMEIPFGGRPGIYDHKISRHELPEGSFYFVWTVLDTTQSNQYLALVQQERNDAAIALELERLKTENEHLNEMVAMRTAEIRQQAELIKMQNNNILQSIQCASRIQKAFQPHSIDFNNRLDYFVINLPRDVVSGDFFWAYSQPDWAVVAAVDCTGHGVPGAFLSLVGYTLLDQIVKTDRITHPSEILNQLNTRFFNLMTHQLNEPSLSEGMDMALVFIDFEAKEWTFSGAKRPIAYYKNGEVVEIKGSTATIGGKVIKERSYESHKLTYEPGDILYLYTDGFQDQFGGVEHKRFGSINFKRLLQSVSSLPFENQKDVILQTFNDWKGHVKQIDDVTIIGLKLK